MPPLQLSTPYNNLSTKDKKILRLLACQAIESRLTSNLNWFIKTTMNTYYRFYIDDFVYTYEAVPRARSNAFFVLRCIAESNEFEDIFKPVSFFSEKHLTIAQMISLGSSFEVKGHTMRDLSVGLMYYIGTKLNGVFNEKMSELIMLSGLEHHLFPLLTPFGFDEVTRAFLVELKDLFYGIARNDVNRDIREIVNCNYLHLCHKSTFYKMGGDKRRMVDGIIKLFEMEWEYVCGKTLDEMANYEESFGGMGW